MIESLKIIIEVQFYDAYKYVNHTNLFQNFVGSMICHYQEGLWYTRSEKNQVCNIILLTCVYISQPTDRVYIRRNYIDYMTETKKLIFPNNSKTKTKQK